MVARPVDMAPQHVPIAVSSSDPEAELAMSRTVSSASVAAAHKQRGEKTQPSTWAAEQKAPEKQMVPESTGAAQAGGDSVAEVHADSQVQPPQPAQALRQHAVVDSDSKVQLPQPVQLLQHLASMPQQMPAVDSGSCPSATTNAPNVDVEPQDSTSSPQWQSAAGLDNARAVPLAAAATGAGSDMSHAASAAAAASALLNADQTAPLPLPAPSDAGVHHWLIGTARSGNLARATDSPRNGEPAAYVSDSAAEARDVTWRQVRYLSASFR